MTRKFALIALAAVSLTITACASSSIAIDEVDPLPAITPDEAADLLAGSERPVILNVWASWCVPCRSEAPLLREAHRDAGDDVRFVGIAVDDSQTGAREFLAEFGLTRFEHYLDEPGSVPASLGGRGVPLTFFFAPGGELIDLHRGVIDERTLALQVDELRRLAGG